LTPRQELPGNIDCLIKKPTRICAQVENELSHSLLFQFFYGLAQLVIA
jgi:hypothetical protein